VAQKWVRPIKNGVIAIGQCGQTKLAGSGGTFVAIVDDDTNYKPRLLVVAGGAGGAECANKYSNASGTRCGNMSDTVRRSNAKYGGGGNGFKGTKTKKILICSFPKLTYTKSFSPKKLWKHKGRYAYICF